MLVLVMLVDAECASLDPLALGSDALLFAGGGAGHSSSSINSLSLFFFAQPLPTPRRSSGQVKIIGTHMLSCNTAVSQAHVCRKSGGKGQTARSLWVTWDTGLRTQGS